VLEVKGEGRRRTGHEGPEGSRGTLSFTLVLDGGGWSTLLPDRLPRETDPLPIVQDTGLAPDLVWTDAENIALPGFDLRTVQLVASQIPVDFTSPLYSAFEFVNI